MSIIKQIKNNIQKDKDIESLYQTVIPYIDSDNESALTSEGWKMLIHHLYDDVIKQEFGMVPVNDSCWADSYKDGRRRVISLLYVNNSYATFKWGWNFSYIPKIVSDKAVWCRTDKSIYTHTYEVSDHFRNTGEKHQSVVFGKINTFCKPAKSKNMVLNSKNFANYVGHHLGAWEAVLPEIKEYYTATSTYDGMLERINYDSSIPYYRLILSDYPVIYAFIKRYIGNTEQAEKDFQAIPFADVKIKDEYYKKFCMVGKAE